MKMLKKGPQNHRMWGRRVRKSRLFFKIMCLSLYDYQAKASRYRNGLTHLKNRATTNQNLTLHSQKLKRNVFKHKINGNHPTKKRKEERRNRINGKTRFKMETNTYLSIITLNVNGINAPIKRHRVADWIKKKKKKPTICCLQETYLTAKDTYRWKGRGWEKIFHDNGKERKEGVEILI